MAEVEIKDFNDLVKLLKGASAEAVPAAVDAAAAVYLEAARAAAPVSQARQQFKNLPAHPSGQLRASIKVIGGRQTRLLSSAQGNIARRVFVGPEKKTGYYGYLVEKGYTAMGGAGRKARKAKGGTHSQRGVSAGRKIRGRAWFEPAIKAADSAALRAAQDAFNAKLNELASRT
jgi:hypothetical protein